MALPSYRRALLGALLLTQLQTAEAGCSYIGICGTIVFLGHTVDNRQAVFLSKTTTPGKYDVAATDRAIPGDTWVTSGPDSHISVSDNAQQWGGTHALNAYPSVSSPISARAFVDSATQNPNGTVYPIGYQPPNSRPVAITSQITQPVNIQPPQVTYIDGGTGQEGPRVSDVQHPVGVIEATTRETVEYQEHPRELVPPPLVVPKDIVAVASPGVTITGSSNPAVLQPPPLNTVSPPKTPVAVPQPQPVQVKEPPVQVQVRPLDPIVNATKTQSIGPILTPPDQPTVASSGVTTMTTPPLLAAKPSAGSTAVIAPPARPQTVVRPLDAPSVAQPQVNPGAIQLQSAQVTIAQPTVKPQPVVQPPQVSSVTVKPLDVPVLIDRQENTGAIQAPPQQTTQVQSTSTRPTLPHHVVVHPQEPTTVTVKPTDPPSLSQRQDNLGAVQAPPNQTTTFQTTQTKEPVIQGMPPQQVTTLSPGNETNKPPLTRPALPLPQLATRDGRGQAVPRGIRCGELPLTDASQGLIGDQCSQQLGREKHPIVWFDVRDVTIADKRSGLDLRSGSTYSTLGAEWALFDRWSLGLVVGNENTHGTMLSNLAHFRTGKYSVGPYASYALSEEWSINGALTHLREETDVQLLTLNGGYIANHYVVSIGTMASYAFGQNWFRPRIDLLHELTKTNAGIIRGTLLGTTLDLEIPSHRQGSTSISAAVELGRNIALSEDRAIIPHIEFATHYNADSNTIDRWSGDLRLGVRAQFKNRTTIDFSAAKLGISQQDFKSSEVRLMLSHQF